MRNARWLVLFVVPALLLGVFISHARRSGHQAIVSGGQTSADNGLVAISGEVGDDRGPVAGATVRFQASPEAVLTDAQGRFHLPRRPGSSPRVSAWKKGYLIAGAAADASPLFLHLTPLPSDDHEHYAWTDPQPDASQPSNCGNCHAEIHREWSASGHARSVTNRHFLNLYEGSDWQGRRHVGWSLLTEHPDGSGVCTACHAPALAFGDEGYFDLRQARGTAARGVHCDFCHKVADVVNEHIGLTHGRFGLQLLRPAQGQLFFGPLDDVDRGEDAFAPIYRDSRYCASCHEGRVFGVPAYSTYSEWLASPARGEGKHCQTCHMAPSGTLDNLAPGKGGIPRDPRTLGNHRFFAGSLIDMMKRSLKVNIALASHPDGVQADVEVRVDQVGHRVPTGFPDRNILLVVEAFTENGRSLAPRTGPVLPRHAGISFAGRPGRLYAKQLSDFDGHKPAPFWRAQPDPEDSRLIPDQPDRSSYSFPAVPCRVEVRLLYRRFWEEVAIEKNWPDNEAQLVQQSFPILPGKEVRWRGP